MSMEYCISFRKCISLSHLRTDSLTECKRFRHHILKGRIKTVDWRLSLLHGFALIKSRITECILICNGLQMETIHQVRQPQINNKYKWNSLILLE